jgi:hypothetical protein
MADRFYKDLELPDLTVNKNLPNPDAGYIQLVGNDNRLTVQDSTGHKSILEPQVFIGVPTRLPINAALIFEPITINGVQTYSMKVNDGSA